MNETSDIANPYAPPKSTTEASSSTRYLAHDGYSENGMLLCNEYFESPLICVKTGEDLTEETAEPVNILIKYKTRPGRSSWRKLIVGLLKGLYLVGIIFAVNQYFVSGDMLFIVLLVWVYLKLHSWLTWWTSERIMLKLYVSKKYARRRRLIKRLSMGLLIFWAGALLYGIVSDRWGGSPPFSHEIYLNFIFLVFLIYCIVLLFKKKLLLRQRVNGDYVYFKYAHPRYLAALPLREYERFNVE